MTTIASLVRRLLPRGSRPDAKGDISLIPSLPMDVFAVTGSLLERSGAYREVVEPGAWPFDPLGLREDDWYGRLDAVAEAWSYGLVGLGKADEEALRPIVERYESDLPAWEDLNPAAKAIRKKETYLSFNQLRSVDTSVLQREWTALLNHSDVDVCPAPNREQQPWWRPALRLLIAADSACAGAGFMPRLLDGQLRLPNWVQMEIMKNAGQEAESFRVTTIASDLVEQSMVTVLPKTRTSMVGCTLRSLTHNLALLPPTGRVAARWHMHRSRPIAAVPYKGYSLKHRDLNLLLIPFPFSFRSSAFTKKESQDGRKWGYFGLNQDWLRPDDISAQEAIDNICAFVEDLVGRGRHELGEINGVVFPEYALNAETFLAVSERLRASAEVTGFEFLIAGTSSDTTVHDVREAPKGNFASFRGLFRSARDTLNAQRWAVESSRAKHHRWKLDRRQIERYALADRLDPAFNWWEGIPIPPRTMDFFEVRAGTTLSLMICEDLARSDPCQDLIRAIGPNLLIALLMDGPQRAFRWPGHYAGVLADDPGSSVLTLSSYALMNRAAATDSDQSRSIAFFRDSLGLQKELLLPQGFHALAVKLTAHAQEESTLDGRDDGKSAYVWTLREVCPVQDKGIARRSWILG